MHQLLDIKKLLTRECRVKDHPPIGTGYKARLWCSQDGARKKKSKASNQPNIKNRDTVGMHQYDCDSSLVVICRKSDVSTDHVISVNLHHHDDHVPYFDVEMPSGALSYHPIFTIRSPKERPDGKPKNEYWEWEKLPALGEANPD